MKGFYKKSTLIIFLILITTGIAFPQLQNDDIKDNHKISNSDRTKELLDNIKKSLKDLDSDYLTKLRPREYNRALRELHKIYKMIDAIKMHIDEEYHPTPAMSEPDFKNLVNSINNESFEENKIAVLQASARYNFFTVDQIIGLMDLSTFSTWKLKALELTYPSAIDKGNSFKIINSLTFSEDKKKAQEILNQY